MRKKSGFTLIEMMVVVFIIALLLGLMSYGFSKSIRSARIASCNRNISNIIKALQLYLEDYDTSPTGYSSAQQIYGILYYSKENGNMGGITSMSTYVCPATQHLPPETPNGYGQPLVITATHSNQGWFTPAYKGSSIDYWIEKQWQYKDPNDPGEGKWYYYPDLKTFPAGNVIVIEATDFNHDGRNIGYWNGSVRFNNQGEPYPYNVDDEGYLEPNSVAEDRTIYPSS